MARKKKPEPAPFEYPLAAIAWYKRIEKQLHTLESYASTSVSGGTQWIQSMSAYHARSIMDLLASRPPGAEDPAGWYEARVMAALKAAGKS